MHRILENTPPQSSTDSLQDARCLLLDSGSSVWNGLLIQKAVLDLAHCSRLILLPDTCIACWIGTTAASWAASRAASLAASRTSLVLCNTSRCACPVSPSCLLRIPMAQPLLSNFEVLQKIEDSSFCHLDFLNDFCWT